MTEHFFTWGDLVTYGGAVMAVLIITEFTKDLPGIRKIPTRIWAYLVALVLLVPAAIFTADTIRAGHHVTNQTPHGNVEIINGTSVILDGEKAIYLEAGTEVRKGGTLEAR